MIDREEGRCKENGSKERGKEVIRNVLLSHSMDMCDDAVLLSGNRPTASLAGCSFSVVAHIACNGGARRNGRWAHIFGIAGFVL